MDIFKLFFDHDLRLDNLVPRNNKTDESATLADFMKPDLTYSKFYITGTRLEEEQFGLNTLDKSDAIFDRFDKTFKDLLVTTPYGIYDSLSEALSATEIGDAIIISETEADVDFSGLSVDEESNVGHKKEALRKILKTGAYVIYKEKAHHGFDLHLFSLQNIYPALFEHLQPLADNTFRFFSINSKRMGSEKHFYFETWTLDKPPHGAEEVFPETVL